MRSNSSFAVNLVGVVVAAAVSSSLMIWSQDSSPQLTPRELFYREQAPEHNPRAAVPSKSHAGTKPSEKSPNTSNATLAPVGATDEGSGKAVATAAAETSTATKTSPEVSHLGLRYSLLLVDKATGDAKPVSATQVFDEGECFSLEFKSNRSGYLYVFNLGSSGTWKPLLPTAEMPEEGNFVTAFTTMRVPSSHCFRVTGPPGAEHMFVVLSRNAQDVDELNRSIKSGRAGEPQQSSTGEAGGEMKLASNLNQAVQKIASLKSRDLEIQEVGGTKDSGESTPAVYIVHTSATPSDKVMTEIQITHR